MSLTLPETINFCLDLANITKFSVQQSWFDFCETKVFTVCNSSFPELYDYVNREQKDAAVQVSL